MSSSKKIAYLNSRYSAISHTFIHREVKELRKQGIQIITITIRRPLPSDLVSKEIIDEAKSTLVVLSNIFEIIKDGSRIACIYPVSCFLALFYSQKISLSGVRGRILYFIYFIEALRLVKLMQKANATHIHVHMANNSALVALIAKRINNNLSYSLSIHGPAEFLDVEQGRLNLKLEEAVFVRCISNFCKSQIMALLAPEHWKKLHVVHCAVEKNEFVAEKSGSPITNILFVGRIVPEKGPELLLNVLERISNKNNQWLMSFVGGGNLETDLKKKVSNGNLRHYVRFFGFKSPEEVSKIMYASDVLVLPSFMEGVPVVLMEAMARGLIVVTTRIAGIPELVIDKETGFLMTPGSEDELEECLLSIIENKYNFSNVVTKAKHKVTSEFDLQAETKKLYSIFDKYQLIMGRTYDKNEKKNAA